MPKTPTVRVWVKLQFSASPLVNEFLEAKTWGRRLGWCHSRYDLHNLERRRANNLCVKFCYRMCRVCGGVPQTAKVCSFAVIRRLFNRGIVSVFFLCYSDSFTKLNE